MKNNAFLKNEALTNYTRRDWIPAKCSFAVHTTRDATESIKYHSQSEERVGGLSLEAHCSTALALKMGE